jgi:hypothetical protein
MAIDEPVQSESDRAPAKSGRDNPTGNPPGREMSESQHRAAKKEGESKKRMLNLHKPTIPR